MSGNINDDARHRRSRHEQYRVFESGYPLDRLSATDLHFSAPRAERISDAEEFELSLEFWFARRHRAGDHDRDRHRARYALCSDFWGRLQFRRAHHARCELWVADPICAYHGRVDVFRGRLHPSLSRTLLRFL